MGKGRKRYILVKKCFEDGRLIENTFKYKNKSSWTDDISKAHVYLDSNARALMKELNRTDSWWETREIKKEDRVYMLPIKIVVDTDLLEKDGLLTYPLPTKE